MFIPITRGDSYLATFSLYNRDKSIHKMIVGEHLTFTMKTSKNVEEATISRYYGDGILFNQSTNKYEIELDAISTAKLTDIDYPFDIEYVSSMNDVKTLIQGVFKVCLDVTEPNNRENATELLRMSPNLVQNLSPSSAEELWADASQQDPQNEVFLGDFNISMSYREKVSETITITPTKDTQIAAPKDVDHELVEVIIKPIPNNYSDISQTTATAKDLLLGKKFYTSEGQLQEGTIETFSGTDTIVPNKQQQKINTKEKYVLHDFTIEAIPQIYNDTSDATAISSDVLEGKTFYNSTGKNEGTISIYNGATSIIPTEKDTHKFETAGKYVPQTLVVEPIPILTKELDEQDTKLSELESEISVLPNAPDLSHTTATANDIAKGKTAYTKDGLVEGTAVNRLQWICDNIQRLERTFVEYSGSGEELLNIIQGLDTSKVRDFTQSFRKSTLPELTSFDFSSAIIVNYMFYLCPNLEVAELNNLSKATGAAYLFDTCSSLREVKINGVTSTLKTLDDAFRNCPNLERCIITGNTGGVTEFGYLFYGGQKLKEVRTIDLYSATKMTFFSAAPLLETLLLKNIRISLQIGKNNSYGDKLNDESVVFIVKELHDLTGLTSQRLTYSSALDSWTNGVFNRIYVKLIEATDEMRAEDPYIDNKKPCVVCESTDEGAMTLREYAISKNWTLSAT